MCFDELVDGVTCAVFPISGGSGDVLGCIVVPETELSRVARSIGVDAFSSQTDLMRRFESGLVAFAGSSTDEEFDAVLGSYVRSLPDVA